MACQRQREASCPTLPIPLRLDVTLSVEIVLQPIDMWWNQAQKSQWQVVLWWAMVMLHLIWEEGRRNLHNLPLILQTM